MTLETGPKINTKQTQVNEFDEASEPFAQNLGFDVTDENALNLTEEEKALLANAEEATEDGEEQKN